MPESEGAREVVAGRYAIGEIAGRGGSATVYRAKDLRDGSDVALKVLHAEFSGSRAAERFSGEIRLLEGFAHPSILPVLDSGEWNGRPFYVMRFVAGESLQERLRRERRLSFPEAVRIGRALCDALGYAHVRKVVHRDVKPANVMLAGDEVFLTDFGIAKALEPLPGQVHSTTGVARGTRAYMSPEQAMADRDLDHRSDIFSLGCVLYEMIAGQNPFHSADESRMLMRRVTDVPDPLKRHRDGVPPGLEAAVMKALAKEPADRWGTVGEMGAGLGGAGRTQVAWRSRLLHRRGGIALLGGTLVVSVVLVASFLSSRLGASRCSLPLLDKIDSPTIVVALSSIAGSGSSTMVDGMLVGLRRGLDQWRDAEVVLMDPADPRQGGAPSTCETRAREGDILLFASASDMSGSDSVRLELRLRAGDLDAQSVATIPAASAGEPVWTGLVRDALRSGEKHTIYAEADTTATVFAAWRDCRKGWAHLARGALDSAVARFEQSTLLDEAYRCPLLGASIAGVLAGGASTAQWRGAATRALAPGHAWSDTNETLLRSLVAQADSRFSAACPVLDRLAMTRRDDHLLISLVAECLRADSSVVSSPMRGVHFTSSWMRARRLYLRALEVAPVGYERLVLPRLRTILPIAPLVRWGWVEGETVARFAAYPAWIGDTLAFIAAPRADIVESGIKSVPVTLGLALREGKLLQVEIAERWARRSPTSGAAHFAYASALELNGRLVDDSTASPSALRELERANAAVEEPVDPLSILATRSRMLLKAGRLLDLSLAVDSALRRSNVGSLEESRILGPLALLTGRVDRAIALQRAVIRQELPVAVSDAFVRDLARLTTLASLGCCERELDRLEAEMRRRLRVELDSMTRTLWEDRLLLRPRSLGANCRGWKPVLAITDTTDLMVRVQRALAMGDTSWVRSALRALARERAHFGAGDISVDYVVQESYVQLALGDTAAARDATERWLAALPVSGALELSQVSQAAAVPRLLLLSTALDVRMPSTWQALSSPQQAMSALMNRSDQWLKLATARQGSDGTLCMEVPPFTKEDT